MINIRSVRLSPWHWPKIGHGSTKLQFKEIDNTVWFDCLILVATQCLEAAYNLDSIENKEDYPNLIKLFESRSEQVYYVVIKCQQ